MKKAFFLCLFFAVSICLFAQSESDDKHPIDVKLDNCIDEDGSTSGLNMCLTTAAGEWDKELNKYYKLLQTSLSAEQKTVLQDVQRSWIAFKDKEIKLINVTYGGMDGTMWTYVANRAIMEITRKRALDLKHLYENINGN